MSDASSWYVVKQVNGECAIVSSTEVEAQPGVDPSPEAALAETERWGPYDSQQDAIARRVGLIRAGKCQPA